MLLVHRPKYDDWTLSEGEARAGRDARGGALREVEEETGLRCGSDASCRDRYRDGKGRPKVVRYWAMRPLDGAFAPHDEVDEVRWATLEEATRLLSHAHDRGVLEAAAR